MFIERDKLATPDLRKRFIDVRLGPGKIIAVFGHTFSYALVEKLTRGVLNRGEIAASDALREPSFLLWG